MAHAMDSKAQRLLAAGLLPYKFVTGTTHATAETVSLVTHGWVDQNGAAITPDYVIAGAREPGAAGLNGMYSASAPTSTQIDIRSNGSSIDYVALCIVS